MSDFLNDIKLNDNWYTPCHILKAVTHFMGKDWFDPCPVNPEFDGLYINWQSDNFINPPYSKKLRRHFVWKGIQEFNKNPASRFLWLVNFGNNKDLWQLHKYASAICIPETRIRFVPGHPSLGDGKSPRYDSIFVLWGNPHGFREHFQHIGKVYGEEAP